MAVEVKMPQLGESVTEGTIAKWLVKPGDKVNKYDPLCEVMTDKVNAEVPSTVSGVIKEILVPEGETVSVGTPICLMEAEGEGSAEDAAKDGAEAAPQAEAAQSPAPAGAPAEGASEGKPAAPAAALPRDQKRRYSPAVLKLAQEYGIDLSQVPGTGREGRVTRKDVLRFIEQGGAAAQAAQPASAAPATPTRAAAQPVAQPADQARQPASQAAPQPASAAPGVKTEPGDQVIPVTPVRRAIATRMVQSKHEAPHAWTMVEVDVTGLVKLREAVKAEFEKREGFKLTYLPFVIKAVVESLKEYPILNSVWAGDSIVLKKRINISIAVATEDALYVPVIKDA
nr:branched-chain alpha-keto acid dehydrogenase subunit E2 [Bacillota bacterium]